MSQLINTKERNIKNTFVPLCRSEWLSINGIIAFLRIGACSMRDMPPKVADDVQSVLDSRNQNRSQPN